MSADVLDLATMTARELARRGCKALPSNSAQVPTRALASVLGHDPSARELRTFRSQVAAMVGQLHEVM